MADSTAEPEPSTPARQPRIRQNPNVNDGNRPTGMQDCPIHGAYETPTEVAHLRRRATADPGVSPVYARSLLKTSERLRRHCPQCRGPAPTSLARILRAQVANQQRQREHASRRSRP